MKNLTIITIVIAMFGFASSCDKDEITTTTDFELNETFEIKYEGLAQLSSADLQLMVVEVIEDSRCPIDAFCVWAGQVKLKLEIIDNGTKIFEEIDFSGGNSTDVIVGEYLIKLNEVTPENQVDEVIELEDYTFTFSVVNK